MSHLESFIQRRSMQRVADLWSIDSSKLITSKDGYPDTIFWLPFRPVLIEFKQAGVFEDPLQHHIIGNLQSWGYDVHVCDSVQGALWVIYHALIKRGIKCAPPPGE